MILLAAAVHAAPVECDPLAAARVLAEARVDEAGAPRTHPWLIPGLALASPRPDPDLRAALAELCAPGGDLSIRPDAHWETTGWSAHTLRLTRSETRDCILFERSVAITVGVLPGAAPRYALQATLPIAHTPVGACDVPARWREEQVLAGGDGPVRLVLASVRDDGAVTASEVQVRRATPTGWHEQVLREPAPERLLGGFPGALWQLSASNGDFVIVESHGRDGTADACTPVPGQTVWTWDGATWVDRSGDAARRLLAERGLWRLAGEAGWLAILAQDDEAAADLVHSRRRRLERAHPGPLLVLRSGDFPELNAGFLVVAPPPFADEAAAEAARRGYGRRASTYVKRAWPAPDACDEPSPAARGR